MLGTTHMLTDRGENDNNGGRSICIPYKWGTSQITVLCLVPDLSGLLLSYICTFE